MVHSRRQKIRGVTENSANTEGGKIQSRRKGESHRDTFRPCSRVLSGGRTSRETNWKSRTDEKDRFNQQQGTLIFFITITNRDITKQTDQYLSQKNQEFNDLNKAVMETLYFCFLRYFSERCRETIMLDIFLIMQSELNAIPS